jgi:hypothetical protein
MKTLLFLLLIAALFGLDGVSVFFLVCTGLALTLFLLGGPSAPQATFLPAPVHHHPQLRKLTKQLIFAAALFTVLCFVGAAFNVMSH